MKTKQILGICITFLGAIGLHAQTVDIADFLVLETDQNRVMPGQGAWGTNQHFVNGRLRVRKSFDFEGTRVLSFRDSTWGIRYELVLSMTDTHLFLHHIDFLDQWPEMNNPPPPATLTEPLAILPRMVTLGETYPATGSSSEGTYSEEVRVMLIEEKTVHDDWTAETLKVKLFGSTYPSLTLWMVRDMGVIALYTNWPFGEWPGTATCQMDPDGSEPDPQPALGLWAETLSRKPNDNTGWRACDWYGWLWTESVDSPWAMHLGLGWVYCTGDFDNLWQYLPGVGWMWTSKLTYPWMYQGNTGHWMVYYNKKDSLWFYDTVDEIWVDYGG